MTTVFILQHSYERNDYEETKFIGVYSTFEKGQATIEKLKKVPGFIDHPNDFYLTEYEINKDQWTEGFSTLTNIQVRQADNSWITLTAKLLPGNIYQILEPHGNDEFCNFKHLDKVICEERENDLYAIKLAE